MKATNHAEKSRNALEEPGNCNQDEESDSVLRLEGGPLFYEKADRFIDRNCTTRKQADLPRRTEGKCQGPLTRSFHGLVYFARASVICD